MATEDHMVQFVQNEIDISRVRDILGLTQERIGELVGVGKKTVSAWERGVKRPGRESCIFLYPLVREAMNLKGYESIRRYK